SGGVSSGGVSSEGDSSQAPASSRLAITALRASGGVDVEMRDPDLTLHGDRLVLNEAADHIEIFASPERPDEPARVDLPEGTLFGEHLIVHQQAQTLDVPTAGILDLDTLPGDQQGELRIAWN